MFTAGQRVLRKALPDWYPAAGANPSRQGHRDRRTGSAGASFRWLLSATTINNIGDGVALSAGPLLVASETRDPFLVSMALLAEYLPVLRFGILGGAAADRFDRRRMVIAVNLGRAVVLVMLVVTVVTGTVNIAIVLGVLFLLGTAETFADSASGTLIPGLVAREDLGIANARMQGAFLPTNQLLTPPIGAFLFAAGMALPHCSLRSWQSYPVL